MGDTLEADKIMVEAVRSFLLVHAELRRQEGDLSRGLEVSERHAQGLKVLADGLRSMQDEASSLDQVRKAEAASHAATVRAEFPSIRADIADLSAEISQLKKVQESSCATLSKQLQSEKSSILATLNDDRKILRAIQKEQAALRSEQAALKAILDTGFSRAVGAQSRLGRLMGLMLAFLLLDASGGLSRILSMLSTALHW